MRTPAFSATGIIAFRKYVMLSHICASEIGGSTGVAGFFRYSS